MTDVTVVVVFDCNLSLMRQLEGGFQQPVCFSGYERLERLPDQDSTLTFAALSKIVAPSQRSSAHPPISSPDRMLTQEQHQDRPSGSLTPSPLCAVNVACKDAATV